MHALLVVVAVVGRHFSGYWRRRPWRAGTGTGTARVRQSPLGRRRAAVVKISHFHFCLFVEIVGFVSPSPIPVIIRVGIIQRSTNGDIHVMVLGSAVGSNKQTKK